MKNVNKQRIKITEYTDVKDIKHKVEHLTAPDIDGHNEERIVEELLNALTRPNKRIPA